MNKIKVCHMLCGLDSAPIGFMNADKDGIFDHIWFHNFESESKVQHAATIHLNHFEEDTFINTDIRDLSVHCMHIPECDIMTMLLSNEHFEEGSTPLNDIMRFIGNMEKMPKMLVIECPEKIMTQPQDHRGYMIYSMLCFLRGMHYFSEWRVINPADYGMPQKRKRVYIIAYQKEFFMEKFGNEFDWILYNGVLAKAFPCKISDEMIYNSYDRDVIDIDDFSSNIREKTLENSGFMNDDAIYTCKVDSFYNGKFKTLDDIVIDGDDHEKYITEELYLEDDKINLWAAKKGKKQLDRMNKVTGEQYVYTEGAMMFPDPLCRPSRAILSSEGSKAPSRFTHVIEDPVNGRLRRLAPIELERLFELPDNYTAGLPDSIRASILGKASITTVFKNIAQQILALFVPESSDAKDDMQIVENLLKDLIDNKPIDENRKQMAYQAFINIKDKMTV